MPKKTDKIASIQQTVFTGRVDELNLFRRLLPLDRPSSESIDVLVIYGIGGIGKSELLNQFQRAAIEASVLNARLDAQVQKGIFDFLTVIHEQLKAYIRFPQFQEGLKRRQEIEDKLLGRGDIPKGVLQMFAKGAHTALKIGASFVPGASLVTDLISPEHVEAAVSTIYSAVGRKEGDFWMKPEEELTDRLVADLYPHTEQHRLVLIFDTYELIGGFDDWVCNRLFGNLGEHALLVVAGRQPLQGKGWQRYAPLTRQVELKPLTNEEAREYLRKKGIMNDRVATQMADYTDGVPLTLTLLAELAQQASITDLDLTHAPERHKVIEELLRRITHNVAESLRVALQMCAILRVVTEDSLAYMLDRPDVEKVFAELIRFDFIKVRNDGIALHDAVWAAMNEELSWRSPTQFRNLNAKASQFYKEKFSLPNVGGRDFHEREHLYHSFRADESQGRRLFQQMVERLVRYRLMGNLTVITNDVSTYQNTLEQENSHLWLRYYKARLLHLMRRLHDAESEYIAIAEDEQAEKRLRGYALADWASIRRQREHISRPGGLQKLIEIVEQSDRMLPSNDPKRLINILSLAKAYSRAEQLDQALIYFEKAKSLASQYEDNYAVAHTLVGLLDLYAVAGDWRKMLDTQIEVLAVLGESYQASEAYADALAHWSVAWAWAGKYLEAEHKVRTAWSVRTQMGDIDFTGLCRDLGFSLGTQGKFLEAMNYFLTGQKNHEDMLSREDDTSFGFQGAILMRQGEFSRAEQLLNRSWTLNTELADDSGLPEVANWLGQLSETIGQQSQAEAEYNRGLQYRNLNRHYFECGILTGLVRVKHAQADFERLISLWSEAESLARQYEYNDHLCSLCLTQAHVTWQGHYPRWGNGFEPALDRYKQALTYALRYNRFLLDEALSGRPQGTPLTPILPHCLTKGEEGRKMLIALREWWQSGTNDIVTPRPETISPIPEGVPLSEGERIARQREPGDGSPQLTVIEQIEKAILQLV